MADAGSPPPGEQLELSVFPLQPDEQTPLNGAVLTLRSSPEPSGAQAIKDSPWSLCNKNLVGKCRLWMVIVSIFIGFVVIIILSLGLISAIYIDEDENEILDLSSNKTFLVRLKIPEECVAEELCDQLTERLADVYSSSPSLRRYFMSVEMVACSGDNSTVAYHLQFGLPSPDDGFMKYRMNEELVLGILRQDFHDRTLPGCKTLGLDPASFSFSVFHSFKVVHTQGYYVSSSSIHDYPLFFSYLGSQLGEVTNDFSRQQAEDNHTVYYEETGREERDLPQRQ
ncbi:TPA-induced transmembrane protein [Tenrec ecaudatus]|uniref:TPA-induced transmembrane protein n=1 Tax=Tenrec ecaudatus TaxID=94439 RepID=UPI003F5ABDB5